MSDPAFTVLLPVHRGAELLPFAIDSVLAQTRGDFELFVICDGAPPATADHARSRAAADPRIRLFEHDKGERHGEVYRHAALDGAHGTYVCQLADDDLWFPDHLAEMARLLEGCDFGNLTQTNIEPDGHVRPSYRDLSDPATRAWLMTRTASFFGPSASGYRLAAYRGLAQGWAPAPWGIGSDLFMWRKFLQSPGVRVATRHAITSLAFATPQRRDWPIAERQAENERYARLLATAEGRSDLRAAAMRTRNQQHATFHLRLNESRRAKLARFALRLFGRPAT